MPKRKKDESSKLKVAKSSGSLQISKVKHERPKSDLKTRAKWIKLLRPRDTLVKRGQATAIGIQVVKNQLRTINSTMRGQLLSTTPPFGYGVFTTPPHRETELLDCLYELRELITTLQFHLDIDDTMALPSHIEITETSGLPQLGKSKYSALLGKSGDPVGEIALRGLVNRYSSAVFSDHHGLLLHAKIDDRPDLHIYYQSLDATHNFSGGTVVRSGGGLLPFTGPSSHSVSLRGAVGFVEQLHKLQRSHPQINVIILAEVGQQDANALLRDILQDGWKGSSNNSSKSSGVNDITMLYAPSLESDYSFSVVETDLGNAARIRSDAGKKSECTLLGCHILNKVSNNKAVGAYMKSARVAALFGDTNISTKGSSLGFKFDTIQSQTSVTDSLTFNSSNSAGTAMFDKLLVRTS